MGMCYKCLTPYFIFHATNARTIRYIIPPKFREVLSMVWQNTEFMHWWLPNNQDYPDIVRQIREMTDERLKQPRDNFRSDVRDLKGLFWKLNVDEGDEEYSPPHTNQK